MEAPSTLRREHAALQRLAQSWGGSLEFFPHDVDFPFPRDSDPCPFESRLYVQYDRMRIVSSESTSWVSIIHEMGHVFASRVVPDKSDEVMFFGWEYLVAKKIRANIGAWKRGQAGYSIGAEVLGMVRATSDGLTSSHDFDYLSGPEQMRVIRFQIETGKSLGIIDADGNPVSIRGEG